MNPTSKDKVVQYDCTGLHLKKNYTDLSFLAGFYTNEKC